MPLRSFVLSIALTLALTALGCGDDEGGGTETPALGCTMSGTDRCECNSSTSPSATTCNETTFPDSYCCKSGSGNYCYCQRVRCRQSTIGCYCSPITTTAVESGDDVTACTGTYTCQDTYSGVCSGGDYECLSTEEPVFDCSISSILAHDWCADGIDMEMTTSCDD